MTVGLRLSPNKFTMPTRVTLGSDMAVKDITGAGGLEFYTTQAMSLNASCIDDTAPAGMDYSRLELVPAGCRGRASAYKGCSRSFDVNKARQEYVR